MLGSLVGWGRGSFSSRLRLKDIRRSQRPDEEDDGRLALPHQFGGEEENEKISYCQSQSLTKSEKETESWNSHARCN